MHSLVAGIPAKNVDSTSTTSSYDSTSKGSAVEESTTTEDEEETTDEVTTTEMADVTTTPKTSSTSASPDYDAGERNQIDQDDAMDEIWRKEDVEEEEERSLSSR